MSSFSSLDQLRGLGRLVIELRGGVHLFGLSFFARIAMRVVFVILFAGFYLCLFLLILLLQFRFIGESIINVIFYFVEDAGVGLNTLGVVVNVVLLCLAGPGNLSNHVEVCFGRLLELLIPFE